MDQLHWKNRPRDEQDEEHGSDNLIWKTQIWGSCELQLLYRQINVTYQLTA